MIINNYNMMMQVHQLQQDPTLTAVGHTLPVPAILDEPTDRVFIFIFHGIHSAESKTELDKQFAFNNLWAILYSGLLCLFQPFWIKPLRHAISKQRRLILQAFHLKVFVFVVYFGFAHALSALEQRGGRFTCRGG